VEKKQNLLQQEKKSPSSIYLDPCPACDGDLYFNDKFTKRVALLKKSKMIGWMCPFCSCEFDLKDNLVYINVEENKAGKA
jgi:hypothetical protein